MPESVAASEAMETLAALLATVLVSTSECVAGSPVVRVIGGVGADGGVGDGVGVHVRVCRGSWCASVLLTRCMVLRVS